MTTMERKTPTLGRRAVLAMAVSAMALAGAARAQAPGDLVDVTVVDRETGEPARVWRHQGRSYVAGRPGARYGLRITNQTSGRVLVVVSVDGVNVVTGQTAGYNQTGYVFGPYQSYDVNGWRKSGAEVAAFTFADLPQSYAARTGRPGDVGVIGIAAFRERVAAPPVAIAPAAPTYEARSRPHAGAESAEEVVVTGSRRGAVAAAPPPAAVAAAPAQRRTEKLGTAHGQREWSVATRVGFERATTYPQLIRRIEYDSYPNLVAMGVIRPPRPLPHRPRPFPSNSGYVPDPPGGS